MKILVYGNRKQDDSYWDISTPEKEAAAFLALFKILDGDWQVYTCDDLTKPQQGLYEKAKAGDAQAAKQLLTARKRYEYEQWSFATVKDPLELPASL